MAMQCDNDRISDHVLFIRYVLLGKHLVHFVAFALMNGSGRAIGLDRWVIPWLQRTLGNWWYGRPSAQYGKK